MYLLYGERQKERKDDMEGQTAHGLFLIQELMPLSWNITIKVSIMVSYVLVGNKADVCVSAKRKIVHSWPFITNVKEIHEESFKLN